MREKLIEVIEQADGHSSLEIHDIYRFVDSLIANDVVPVVRCKDCDKFCPEEIRKLYNTEKYCMRTGWMVKDDDFCSYGERRTDERKADCVD